MILFHFLIIPRVSSYILSMLEILFRMLTLFDGETDVKLAIEKQKTEVKFKRTLEN